MPKTTTPARPVPEKDFYARLASAEAAIDRIEALLDEVRALATAATRKQG